MNHPDLPKDIKPLRVISKDEWFKARPQSARPGQNNKLVPRDGKPQKMSYDCRVRIYGIKDSKATWVDIKDAVKKFAEPKFIDYRPGEKEGILQFASKEERSKFIKESRDEKIRINEHKVKFEELSRSSEERYLKKKQQNKMKPYGFQKAPRSHK